MRALPQGKPNNPLTQPKSDLWTWLWLLFIAPGRVVTLHSPLAVDEVARRLRNAPKVARLLKPSQAIIRLPDERNQRRLYIWFEPDAAGTRISGQTQTPYQVALVRMLITMALYGLAIMWLPAGRVWLGVMFTLGGTGFLLLAQYERLVGRDLRLHLEWLRLTLDAHKV